jgi:hypothetical protein
MTVRVQVVAETDNPEMRPHGVAIGTEGWAKPVMGGYLLEIFMTDEEVEVLR